MVIKLMYHVGLVRVYDGNVQSELPSAQKAYDKIMLRQLNIT